MTARKVICMGVLVITVLLSLAAGGAKVANMPQEVQFFQNAGLSIGLMTAFGIAQVIGGLLLIFARTRTIGAVIAALGFLASVVVIFMNGQTQFALFSLLPVALAVAIPFCVARKAAEQSA